MTTVGVRYKSLRTHEKNILKEEKGSCEICGKADNLVVDHDHLSGLVRGVVCSSCNLRLGWIDSMKEPWLKKAAEYLKNQNRTSMIIEVFRNRFERLNKKLYDEKDELHRKLFQLEQELEKSRVRRNEIEKFLETEEIP